MLPGKTYTPDDFARIAWRRKWAILVPFLLIATTTAVIAHYLPNRYRSETVILVVPQQVPESYVRSTITSRIDDRLQTISQQILSRSRLERIITEFNLYPKEWATGIKEDVVEKMRRDIKVDILKGDAFKVAYIGDNAITVMKVTDRLATQFIDENLKDRAVMAQGTSQFLTVQLEEARQKLAEQEKKLEAYKERHAGELPSQSDSNLQVVQNTAMQIQAILESLNRAQDRRLLVERALADLTAADSQPAPFSENLADLPAAQQLARAQQELRAMELRYKPDHPDIIKAKKVIAGLQQRAEAEAMATPLSPDADAGASPAQLARRNQVKERQQELESLDRQIATMRAEVERLRKVTGAYQARLEAVPTRETELAELTRDYATMQTIYSGLLAKSQESKVAANLEAREIGEQFKLLDPAHPAEKPFSPNRPRINILGSLFGLGLGLGLAAFLEFRDSSFRTLEDVTSVLNLPVLAQIPLIITAAERRKIGRRRLMVSTAVAVVFVAAGAVVWKLGVLDGLLR